LDKVGFGIIGCGAIAPMHAQSLAEIDCAELVAVSDVVERNAALLTERYPAATYSDYHEMLQRDDVAAVSVCVPSGLRVEIVEACAAAGKHVLVEKPLEVNTQRIDQILNACDAAGVRIGCIFQTRFARGPALVRKAVDGGRFGKLVLGDAYIKWHRTQAYYDSGAWRGTKQYDGGGALMNQGIHQVDLLLWFMGNVRRVQAQTALMGHQGLEVEDLACVMLQFENGAHGVIEASTAIWPGHSAKVEIHGTDGSIVLDSGEIRSWQFRDESTEDAEVQAMLEGESELGSGASDPTAGLKHEGHRRQIGDFAQALLDNRPPAIDGREGRRAVALIEAAYESAEKGAAIDVDI
jgi:predicted dehydrogenase